MTVAAFAITVAAAIILFWGLVLDMKGIIWSTIEEDY